MSTSIPSDTETQPGSLPSDLPPDPLVASGSFISSTTTENLKQSPILGGSGVIDSEEMSNDTDQVHPSPDSSNQQTGSKRKRAAAPVDNNWLPPGWRVEDRVRSSGARAGTVDKYYYEPITGRQFRSRNEVLYYLEHGTAKKGSSKKAEKTDFNSDHLEGQGSSKARRKAKDPPPRPPPLQPLNFDFENPPEKISWGMTKTGEEEAWTPFIGDDKVQDLVRRDWSTAFFAITSRNASKLS